MNDEQVRIGPAEDAGGSAPRRSEGIRRPKRGLRWKHFFPIFKCPGCGRYLVLEERAEYKLRSASKKEQERVRHDR